MRLVFLGSGAFGLPTLERLHQDHEVVAVVTAMPRKAGRNQNKRVTPVGDWAVKHGIHAIETDDVNEPSVIEQIEAVTADAMVVIAFGQRLFAEAIGEHFAINLHASLLPTWRGAAPINAAIMHGDKQTGVSVISLAERMDAGLIYGTRTTKIGEVETAGELHDRLALLGVELVIDVLNGDRTGKMQNEDAATVAPKLSRQDSQLDLTQDASLLAQKIRGLSPWPGCHLEIAGVDCKLLRATCNDATGPVGEILQGGMIAVGVGSLEILDLQPAGSKAMKWVDFCNGRSVKEGDKCVVAP